MANAIAAVIGYIVLAFWCFVTILVIASCIRMAIHDRREAREWTERDDRLLEHHRKRETDR